MEKRQPPPHAVFADDPDPDDPLIGARLRYGLGLVEQRILQALIDAGFTDLNAAHFKVLRFPPPECERPGDLAQRAGMTKQAMNYLLVQLESMGYVQRVAADAGMRLVSLTPTGWEVARIQRATVRAIEAEWQARVGKARFDDFYAVLKTLTDS